MDKHKHLPSDAFHFKANPAEIKGAPTEGEQRHFSGTPYTGKPLRHPFWGTVVFDLSDAEANDPTPVLVDHDRSQRAGFAALQFSDEIKIDDGTLLGNQHGNSVAEDSDAGFPWQMSIHIEPGTIEEINSGTEVEVNGNTVHGPAVVFRKNFVREVSFTPTGVDYNTSAAAFSAGHDTPTEEQDTMTLEEMQKQVADLEAKFSAEQEARQAAEARAKEAEDQLAQFSAEKRDAAIKEMFASAGMEYSDEAAKPYKDMDENTFSAVSEQMKGVVKKTEQTSELFGAQATEGQDHQASAETAASLNPAEIYSKRNAG